jgi:hypothetical protein
MITQTTSTDAALRYLPPFIRQEVLTKAEYIISNSNPWEFLEWAPDHDLDNQSLELAVVTRLATRLIARSLIISKYVETSICK